MPIGPSERIAAAIREDIDSGTIGSGAKLPGERELSQLHAVSISTISRAIALLRGDRYIESRRGLGNFVVDRPGRLTVSMETSLTLLDQQSRTGVASTRIAASLDIQTGVPIHTATWSGHADGRLVARIEAVSTRMPTEVDLKVRGRDSVVSARLPDEAEAQHLGISLLTPVLVVTHRRQRSGDTPGVAVDLIYPSATVHLAWPARPHT